MAFSDPDRDRAQAEWHSAGRTVKGLVLKLRKFSATTPAGLFAKAVAVSRMGTAAATIAISLADDLVNSAELPRAVWPAADQQR